jgi:hypothetical protein
MTAIHKVRIISDCSIAPIDGFKNSGTNYKHIVLKFQEFTGIYMMILFNI